MNRRTFLTSAAFAVAQSLSRPSRCINHKKPTFDLVVYGGSSAGVAAAIQARRMGKSVVIANPYSFLGGMTASGLSAADVDNPAILSGIALELFTYLNRKYGVDFSSKKLSAVQYEPHVAEIAFRKLAISAGIPIFDNELLDLTSGVILNGRRIASIRMQSGRHFSGKIFIDATYEGDLMAKAGVGYTVGREANSQYGETLNGVQRVSAGDVERLSDIGHDDHFVKNVDPYVVRGNSSSGLLPRINRLSLKNGEADKLLQAYNFRLTLTDDPANKISFDQPRGYRERDHELLLRNFEAGDERLPGRLVRIPNRKIDWNSFGAVGTDMAGANSSYADADHEVRLKIASLHEGYVRGHLWTLAHHPRVPNNIRKEMQRWGYAKDEFQRNGGFPYMLYVREGRRMVGDVVMTEHYCRGQKVVTDPIALASYPMDSHVVQYFVNEHGYVEREGVFFKHCKQPYGVSYRAIVPKRGQCPNLLVPICLSASHAAYGSIRMEPIFIGLAQAAATAACSAIDARVAVQDVSYDILKTRLLADKITLAF